MPWPEAALVAVSSAFLSSYRWLEGGDNLEGQGDLVSRLRTPITHTVAPVIPIIQLFTKSRDPPSRGLGFWGFELFSGLGLTVGFIGLGFRR